MGFSTILREIENGTLKTVAIDTPEPSVFCHEILNANPYAYLDERLWRNGAREPCSCGERRATTSTAPGILDPAAIAQVAAESWPVVRDADELHDALDNADRPPARRAWQAWFDELVSQRRAMPLSDQFRIGPVQNGSISRAPRTSNPVATRGGRHRDFAWLARVERPDGARGDGGTLEHR